MQNEPTIPKEELIIGVREVLSEIQPVTEQPRFDWKWFVGLVLPIVVSILIPGIIGYFKLQTDVAVIRSEVMHIKSDVSSLKTDLKAGLKAVNERIDAVDDQLKTVQINQATMQGKIDLLDETLKNLKKP